LRIKEKETCLTLREHDDDDYDDDDDDEVVSYSLEDKKSLSYGVYNKHSNTCKFILYMFC